MARRERSIAVLLALAALAAPDFASGAARPADPLENAKTAIRQKNFAAALVELQRLAKAGNANAQSILIHFGWIYVVVESAPIIPGDKDRRRFPLRRVHHRIHQPGDIIRTGSNAGGRMLAQIAVRNHPTHLR